MPNEFKVKNGLIVDQGGAVITGSLIAPNITGSLLGTASYALVAQTLLGSVVSASYAATASQATTASYALVAQTLLGSVVSASYAATASQATTASYALTASYVNPLQQDVLITGSLNITGPTVQTGDNTLIGNTILSGSITISGNTLITGSITALNATASFGYVSASFLDVTGKQIIKGYAQFIPTSDIVPITVPGGYIYSSGSNGDLYFSQTNGVLNNTIKLRWLEGNMYSGLLYGGLITTQSSTVYQVSSGSGIIATMNVTLNTEPYPTVAYISWPNLSASIAPLSGSYDQSFISIEQTGSTGKIYAQGTPYNDGQFNTLIPIGNVIHQNRSTINATATYPSVAYAWKQRTNDFIRAFGALKLSGLNTIVSGSSTGSILVTSGTSYAEGRNYTVDPDNPSYVIDSGSPASKIFRYYQSGSDWVYLTNGGAGYATIDPTQYSLNGVLTLVPGTGTNRRWTIQRVYYFPGGATKGIYVYYGNETYETEVEATANIPFEDFVEAPNTAASAILSSYLVVRNNADFTDATSYRIQQGGLFRSVGGSGGGGAAITQTLAGLSDVNISSPTGGQPLVYNGTTLKWENASALTADLTGNATTATSASYASTASYALNAISASFAVNAISSSYPITVTGSTLRSVSPLAGVGGSTINSIFLGSDAGNGASSANNSNFFGQLAGSSATDANNSNFLGNGAGNEATNANNSNFLGYNAGSNATNAANSIFIGREAGLNDTVDNILNDFSSILIGNFTNTGARTNSILLGSGDLGSPVINTKSNQFMLVDSITDVRWRGVEYTLPSSQASGIRVLTNNGSGVLSWATSSVFPFTGSAVITGSLTVTGSLTTTGNVTVAGTLTAQTLVVQTITSSTDFVTGSTRFGSLLSNTHQFTGSVSITGSLTSPNITGSLFGTSSWANNATTASFALNAVPLAGTTNAAPLTGRIRTTNEIGVWRQWEFGGGDKSLYTGVIYGASNVPVTQDSSINQGVHVGNVSTTGSVDIATSTLLASTTDYDGYTESSRIYAESRMNGGVGTGKVIVDAGQGLIGAADYSSFYTTNSFIQQGYLNTVTSSFVRNSQTSSMTVLSSSFASTASFVRLAQSASYVLNAVSASYAATASIATSSSYAISSSFATNALTASYVLNNTSTTFTNQSFAATAAQTTFTISGGYVPGLIVVFYNGSKLATSEYTASNGTTVVLGTAAELDDIIDVNIFTTTDVLTAKAFTTITYSGAPNWDYGTGYNKEITLTGAATLSITNDSDGDYGVLFVTQDVVGGRVLTLPVGDNSTGLSAQTTANSIVIYSYVKRGSVRHWNASNR
jgi:hypothetical protein